MPLNPIDAIFIVGYIVIVLIIGLLSARKKSADEFLIHGRSLNTFQMIATTSASYIGGGAIVAYGAYVYEYGIAAISVYIGFFLNLIFFARYAPAIRARAAEAGHLTLGDYFADNIGPRAGLTAALVSTGAYFLFLANQFIAGSTVLSTLSGWDYETSLYTSAAVVLVYLLLGGMRSVVKTDVFQYFTMVLLIIALGIGLTSQTGIDPELLNPLSMSPGLAIAFILYGLFLPFSAVEIWQRIYAAKDDRSVSHGLIGSGICVMVLGIAIALLGMAAKTAYPGINPSEAIAYGMVQLLPSGLLGLGMVVLFAAIMSTVDTIVFYLSSSIAKDFTQQRNMQSLQNITRASVVLVTLAGVAMAFFFRDIIAVIITIAGVTSGIVPAVIGSLFWKLKERAVVASLGSACVYVVILIGTGNVEPDLAMISLFIAAFVLWIGQKM